MKNDGSRQKEREREGRRKKMKEIRIVTDKECDRSRGEWTGRREWRQWKVMEGKGLGGWREGRTRSVEGGTLLGWG